MSGHKITPYEITATRKFLRDKAKKAEPLVLAALSDKTSVDLLDVVADNILAAKQLSNKDGTRIVQCVAVQRKTDSVEMVFACDVKGEREAIRDGANPGRPAVFMKGEDHVSRFLSCATLFRPKAGTEGLLVVHSPWGRGGSKGNVVALLQKAVNLNADAKAKLSAAPKIPAKVLDRMLARANATAITYSKTTGVTSDNFGGGKKSSPATMDLVVRGEGSIAYRDALTKALRAKANREKFFTVGVRSADGKYVDQEFDDVELQIDTDGGKRTYSMRENTIPTMGFDLTTQLNSVYWGLPDDKDDDWPALLLEEAFEHIRPIVKTVRTSS